MKLYVTRNEVVHEVILTLNPERVMVVVGINSN